MSAGVVSPTTPITIYALLDPDSAEVRYVGRTRNNPWRRYSEHLLGVGKATTPWLRTLQHDHKVPSLKILEEQVIAEQAGAREQYWIAYWRTQGAQLLNYAPRPKPLPHRHPISPTSPRSLLAIFQTHGILSIRELTRRTGLSRQVGWNLWHGYTGIGRKLLPILHDGLGIPYEELLQVDPIPHAQRPRRGRPPRKHPPDKGGASA